VEALLEAVRNGKQVAVVVELQARFDEESNIEWARALERQGVHVVHGLPGLKVHSKVALVVRREGETIRRYLHLATGNYNPTTAHLYTDMGLFTCDAKIGADATALFNYLTGYSGKIEFSKLLVAPVNLRQRLSELIRREIEHQHRGRRGHLIFKMNALEDPGMMGLLSEASRAGVRVDLLVRGICCLRPGVPGVSDNIRVISIVGRFLEHSRVFYFHNGGSEEVYLGSADLMPRNLNRRVEVLFPVSSPRLVRRLRDEILNQYLADDASARHMQRDGSYTPKPKHGRLNSQAWFLAQRTSPTNVADHSFEPHFVKCVEVGGAHEGTKPVLAIAPIFPVHQETVCATSERNEELSTAKESLQGLAARLAADIDSLRKRLSSNALAGEDKR
jgi:polyphosphate kinase